jgi:sec-independent protein translocase protein TatB
MLDFSFGELAVIGAVALVVLGPERLPKVARTVGDWVGKAQRYVNQVKTDINREMELSELKKLQEEARNAAQTFQSSVEGAVGAVEADLNKTTADLGTAYSAGTGGVRRELAASGVSQALQTRPLGRRAGRGDCAPEAPAGHAGCTRRQPPQVRPARPHQSRPYPALAPHVDLAG